MSSYRHDIFHVPTVHCLRRMDTSNSPRSTTTQSSTEQVARSDLNPLSMMVSLLSLGLVIGLGIFAAIEFLAKSPIWSDNGAAWVQAIGAIAAIFCAIYIMKRQGEQAMKLAQEMDSRAVARRLAALEALIERGFAMARTVEVHTDPIASYWDFFFSVVRIDQLRFMRDALKEIPLHTLESYDLVVGVHEMIIGLERLEPLVIIHEAAGNVHYVFEGNDRLRAKNICAKIHEARDLVRKAITEMGHSPIAPLNG